MADQADVAAQNDFTEEILLRRKNALPAKTLPRGKCLNCEAPVAHLYCDDSCREDYEYQERVTKKVNR